MEKKEQLYEGKAKKVFATDDGALCIVSYKDDATAFNGEKKGTIVGKGVVNNRMTNMLMQLLEGRTHALRKRAFRPRHRGEEGADRSARGDRAQRVGGVVRKALRRSRGDRVRRAHHRVFLLKRRFGRSAP